MLTWLEELVGQTCESPAYLAGHLLGGAVAARFAARRSDLVRGWPWWTPSAFAGFGRRRCSPSPWSTSSRGPPTVAATGSCSSAFLDKDSLEQQLGGLWRPLTACALEGARSPAQKTALRTLMPQFGMRTIPESELAGILCPPSSSGDARTAGPLWPWQAVLEALSAGLR